MQNSKLIRLLKLLDPEEFKQFPQFIKSPFFNSNKLFLPLYQALKRYYPDFDAPNLTRELIFRKLFPGKAFHYNIFSNLISGFARLTEAYLANLQFQRENFEYQKMLLKAYENRTAAFPFFKKQMQSLQTELEGSPYRNASYFKEKFGLQQLWFNHPDVDKPLITADQYRDSLDTLDTYFTLEKLLLISELKGREAFLSEKYDIWLFDEIRNKQQDNPLYLIYTHIIELIETDDKTTYWKLKSNFDTHFDRFNRKEQQNILQILINYTIKKGNSGDHSFILENFELYKKGLENDLFTENGQLNDMIYTNIAGVAIKAKAFSWSMDFLNSYEPMLDKKVSKDAKSLSMGFWYSQQGKLLEAIDFLNQVEFLNDFYQLRGRSLLIKIYFAQFLNDSTYFELLMMQCHSFERYIRRNTLIASTKEKAYLDFIMLLRQLGKAVSDFRVSDKLKQKWLKQIDTSTYLYGKDWLMEQIELL